MEWSDYKVHKYILKAYGANEQIAKASDDLGRLLSILKEISAGNDVDNGVMVSAFASVEVMLEELEINFSIGKKVDRAKSDQLANMAEAVGLIDAEEIKITASKFSPKLAPDDVIAIREAYAKKEASQNELALKYNVTSSIISDTVTGVNYKNLGGPVSEKKTMGKFTVGQVVEIRKKYAEGNVTQVGLAEQYGVTCAAINSIVLGKLHRTAPGPITRKGKGNGRIQVKTIEPGIAERIRSDYYDRNHTYKTLSEKYGMPVYIIKKAFREERAKTSQPVKFTRAGNINAPVLHRYVHVKGVIPGEVETFLLQRYDWQKTMEANMSGIQNFATERKWNAKTIQACKQVLKRAYKTNE
jgi:hypothetical protein